MEKKIIAIIPAYNEASEIENVVRKTLEKVNCVIVVDDGSSDNTGDLAFNAGANVISHSFNLGKGMALNTGLKVALSCNADIVVLIDGDGQHSPEEIPNLVSKIIDENLDIVIGSRYLKKNKIPTYRKLGLYILNIVTNLGSGIIVTDTQSGFRALSKKALKLLHFNENGLSVESEMQFLAAKYTLSVGEIPIEVFYNGNKKRNPISHGLSVLIRVIQLIKHYKLPKCERFI